MRTKLFLSSVILVLLSCGKPYIIPQPDFSWPEMASSKIGDSLGIYIPAENLSFIYKSDIAKQRCKHKNILIGKGILKAVKSSVQAVFCRAVILGSRPTDTYIKSLKLRGLLHVKDITASVEFVPFVDDDFNENEIDRHEIILNLSLNLTAIDFTLSDIREFNIDVSTSNEQPVTQREVNRAIETLCKNGFERVADELARELVTIYGARL